MVDRGLMVSEFGVAKGDEEASVGERPLGESPTGDSLPYDGAEVMLLAVISERLLA
jgi:hypothetical protein